jgi:hypothetical protein
MRTHIPFILVLSLASCHGGSDRNDITFTVAKGCDLVETPGTIALPFVTLGTAGFVQSNVAICDPDRDCLTPKPTRACTLRRQAQVQVLSVLPDGIIGRVIDDDASKAMCMDRTEVFLPRALFKSQAGFDLAVGDFPAHCSKSS